MWTTSHQPESSLNRVAQWTTSHCTAQSALKARAWSAKIMFNSHKFPWHVPKPKLNWRAGSLVCQLACLMPDSSRVNWWSTLRPWPAHKKWGDSCSTVLHVVSHASFRLAKRGLVKFPVYVGQVSNWTRQSIQSVNQTEWHWQVH